MTDKLLAGWIGGITGLYSFAMSPDIGTGVTIVALLSASCFLSYAAGRSAGETDG